MSIVQSSTVKALSTSRYTYTHTDNTGIVAQKTQKTSLVYLTCTVHITHSLYSTSSPGNLPQVVHMYYKPLGVGGGVAAGDTSHSG